MIPANRIAIAQYRNIRPSFLVGITCYRDPHLSDSFARDARLFAVRLMFNRAIDLSSDPMYHQQVVTRVFVLGCEWY